MRYFFSRLFIVMTMLFLGMNIAHATAVTTQEPIRIVVQKGDTLSQIAKEHRTTWQILQKVNGIKNPHLIYPNDVIHITHASNLKTNTMHAYVKKKISASELTTAPFLWKNPGHARCIKCKLIPSVRGLGFPDVVAKTLIEKVRNRDFTMIKISRGVHFDAMYFGKRVRKENVIASWKDGHTEPAREYSVIHEGTRYALVYPLICGNWSKTTSVVPLPVAIVPAENTEINGEIPDNQIAGIGPPMAPEPIPIHTTEEKACTTCPDFTIIVTFDPLPKEEKSTYGLTDY